MLAAGADAQSPLYRAIVRIQSRYRGYVVRKVPADLSPTLHAGALYIMAVATVLGFQQ